MSAKPDRREHDDFTNKNIQPLSNKDSDRNSNNSMPNRQRNNGRNPRANDSNNGSWHSRKPQSQQSQSQSESNNQDKFKKSNTNGRTNAYNGSARETPRGSSNNHQGFKRDRERSVSPSSSAKRRQFHQQNRSQTDNRPQSNNDKSFVSKEKVVFSLRDKGSNNQQGVNFNGPSGVNAIQNKQRAKKNGWPKDDTSANSDSRKPVAAPTGPRGLGQNSHQSNRPERPNDDYSNRNQKRNRRKMNPQDQPQNQADQSNQFKKGANPQRRKKMVSNTDYLEEESPPSEDEQPASINPITIRASSIYARQLQVGEGTYGKVYKAKNEVTGRLVALKRLRLESEREGMPITAVREIKILQSLHHINIVSLQEMMVEQGNVYMAFEYMDHDLAGILAHPELTLTPANIKNLFKQMLEGLNYIHKKGILHRDIKGSNILIGSSGTVKLADFGLARKVDLDNPSAHYTNRVITLWYRPPELLLGATVYDGAIDVWGMGCLFLELFKKKAVFQGRDEVSQLSAIYSIMGTPLVKSWPDIVTLPWYHLLIPETAVPNTFSSYINELLPSDDCKDLSSVLLTLDPKKRLKAFEALRHPYFENEPAPEAISLDNIGEWHEFEAKQIRRKEREMLKRKETEDAQKTQETGHDSAAAQSELR